MSRYELDNYSQGRACVGPELIIMGSCSLYQAGLPAHSEKADGTRHYPCHFRRHDLRLLRLFVARLAPVSIPKETGQFCHGNGGKKYQRAIVLFSHEADKTPLLRCLGIPTLSRFLSSSLCRKP